MKLPEVPPSLPWLIGHVASTNAARLADVLTTPLADAYLHWDDLRHRSPSDGLSVHEWWLRLKIGRQAQARELPLRDADGRPFWYTLPDRVLEAVHRVDQRASGEIVLSEIVTNQAERRRYLVSGLMEEAIASSQLEGASTTRRVAREMLRTGRRPRTLSERMIVNNYRAIVRVAEMAGEPITPERALELHRILTEGTLEVPEAAGRIQRPGDERVVVVDPGDGETLHTPPPAEQLPERLDALCRFANADPDEPFVHPVIRAIVVHLWLAYDHPFEDGNGRTARALFSWVMLSQGYWLTEYLSISRLLNASRARYRRAFLLTETDDRDATYFLLHQLPVIVRAIDELHRYLRQKMAELRDLDGQLRDADLNHRQLALLGNALRHPEADYTYLSHAASHRVARQSARNDILDLEARGYLQRRRVGRTTHFRPVPDLDTRVGVSVERRRTAIQQVLAAEPMRLPADPSELRKESDAARGRSR